MLLVKIGWYLLFICVGRLKEMLLGMWNFTRAALRWGGTSVLQIKHLGAKFLWKQIQIVFTSERL